MSAAGQPPILWLARRLIWLFLGWTALLTGADADLWGHVRFGLDFLQSWHLPSIDTYSYAQDLPWINHEWLSEAIMGGAYGFGGSTGLVVVKAAAVILTYVLLIGAYSGAPLLVGEAATLFVMWGSLPLTMSVRPQIWTFLLVAAVVRLTRVSSLPGEQHTTRGLSPWRLLLIPLLFASWVNLHGGWIVGAALIGLWCAGEVWERRRLDVKIVGLAAACGLATLVNPYGWGLWRFIAETVRLSRDDIIEWHSLWTAPLSDQLFWLATLAVGAYCAVRKAHRPRWDVLVTLGGLAFASYRVRRLEPMFMETSLIMLAPAIGAHLAWLSKRLEPRPGPTVAGVRLVNGVLIAAFTVIVVVAARTHLVCIPPVPPEPDGRVAALAAHAVPGRVAVPFNWGEYAIWHFSPRLKVSIDGRRETLYSEERLAVQFDLERGDPEGLRLLDRERPEYVWMPTAHDRLLAALPAHGYRIDVQTKESYIAVRQDLARLHLPTREPSGCFPAP